MKQLAVGSNPNFINDCGLKVHKDSPGHMLAAASLREEGVEAVIAATGLLVRGHGAIRLDAMFQTVELPTSIAYLATSLANVDRDAFTLKMRKINIQKCFMKKNYFL